MKYPVAHDKCTDELVAVLSDRVTCGRMAGYMVRKLREGATPYFQISGNLALQDGLVAAIIRPRLRLVAVDGEIRA